MTVLIVCDKMQEINRIRRYFDETAYTVKATGAMQSAAYVASTTETDIVVYQLGEDFSQFFSFYRQMRENPQTKNIPMLVASDISVMKPFSDHIALESALLVSSGIPKDAMLASVDKLIKQKVYQYKV